MTDSSIYLKNGEYDYKQEYEHRNITFIGEDTSKTIINGNGSTINITEFVSFNNLTLKNIKIYAPKNLTSSNVIFKDFKYKYSEDFPTGMIYNDYSGSSNINLVNCTFYNNTILSNNLCRKIKPQHFQLRIYQQQSGISFRSSDMRKIINQYNRFQIREQYRKKHPVYSCK